ncbi:Uncharacterized protein APZ42_017176 [Daphnia magna]|uniref:Uncharacterized protein n=1 Tax=Daphnia magna TaxID=35525 RepID=A0A164ZNV7_9CRUS|nr:Uncharacterized protein APZ42_017176 [Daphnia magna]
MFIFICCASRRACIINEENQWTSKIVAEVARIVKMVYIITEDDYWKETLADGPEVFHQHRRRPLENEDRRQDRWPEMSGTKFKVSRLIMFYIFILIFGARVFVTPTRSTYGLRESLAKSTGSFPGILRGSSTPPKKASRRRGSSP